jgi:hypothetical protein
MFFWVSGSVNNVACTGRFSLYVILYIVGSSNNCRVLEVYNTVFFFFDCELQFQFYHIELLDGIVVSNLVIIN